MQAKKSKFYGISQEWKRYISTIHLFGEHMSDRFKSQILDNRILGDIRVVVPDLYEIILKGGKEGEKGKNNNNCPQKTRIFCQRFFKAVLFWLSP
jgi:hypothetical protein